MTPADATPRGAARPFLGGWHVLVPILALAATRGLWAPDEPRYAQIAREAWESGSLLVLHLCGDLYPDKPPLVYWMAAGLGAICGWSELALRLPSILATAGSAWIAARIAGRLFGPVAAAWTPVFYLATALVVWMGGRLQLDPVLAFLCLAAVDQLWTDGGDARARTRRALVAGACAGLAALAKGPVAWLIIGLALVAMRLVPRSARAAIALPARAWAGLVALAILPVAAWATAAASVDGRLWRPLFLGQHLGRAADPDAPHAGPPWEHVTEMLVFLLPWTLLVVAGLGAAWRSWRAARRAEPDADAGLVRAGLWFLLVLAFFSAIPPKREVYVLPIYPAAAWFAAVAFRRALERGRLARWIGLGTPLLLLSLGAAACVAPHFVEDARPFALRALPTGLALVAGGGLALVCRARGDLARWADSIALGFSAAALAGALLVVPQVDPLKSAAELAQVVAARPERPERIPCIGVRPEGVRFYGGVPAVRGSPDDLAPALERDGAQALALVSDRAWERLPAELRGRFAVLDRRPVGSRDVLVLGAAVR